MPRGIKNKPVEDNGFEVESTAEINVKPKSVAIIERGIYIRTYSEADHGANFLEIAKGFAEKRRRQLAENGYKDAIIEIR